MFGLGPTELIIILVIILVIFGGKKLPELARSLGEGVREFNQQKEKIQQEYEEVKGSVDMETGAGSGVSDQAPEEATTQNEADSKEQIQEEQAQQAGTDQENSEGSSKEADRVETQDG